MQNQLPKLSLLRRLRLALLAPTAIPLLAERINLQAERIAGLERQLYACRQVLDATVLERNRYASAFDRACHDLLLLKKQRCHEKQQLRTWITRCTHSRPSEN